MVLHKEYYRTHTVPCHSLVTMMALLSCLLLQIIVGIFAENMNGRVGQYKIANGNYDSKIQYNTDYNADGKQREYFEVYSNKIRTQYSEVHWRMHDDILLPESIRKRFANKVMAIVGYEVDQVKKSDASENDISIPITWSYNHHYSAYLLNSKATKLVKTKASEDSIRHGLTHGSHEHWVPQQISNKDSIQKPYKENITLSDTNFQDIPSSQWFSEGNGGEMRLSYHGYPKGYAQLIESPDTFKIQPMQIDTWNREMTDEKFMPGPLPKSSGIPKNSGYSGLLECPCSDRLQRKWFMTYELKDTNDVKQQKCDMPITNATDCFYGARQVIQADKYVEQTISDSSKLEGCSLTQHADGSTDVLWNTKTGQIADATHRQPRLVAFHQGIFNLTVSLVNEEAPDAVRITMVGPSDKWFGIGFGASSMCIHMVADECPDGGPYAIIVNGDGQEGVVERKLDFHGQGIILESRITVESNIVQDGKRVVTLTRPLKGHSSKHYTFQSKISSIPIVMAKGCNLPFAQHCGHGNAKLNFLQAEKPQYICRAGIEGTIDGAQFIEKGRCPPPPTSDLAVQKNPTCSVQTYRGGLNCCRDGHSLLDEEQINPWPEQYLEYYMKFRFYFEDYKQNDQSGIAIPSHQNLVRLAWTTEAFAGEYDIPQCLPGVLPSDCVHVITSRFKLRDIFADYNKTENIKIIYAGPHCHAPTCLSMDLYNADTGRLICHVEPPHGSGNGLYDEHGFLSIPPCLWGDPSEGLQIPELLRPDTTLLSIKRSNNTFPHTGEMASWQMRGIVVPNNNDIDRVKIVDNGASEMLTGRRYFRHRVDRTVKN